MNPRHIPLGRKSIFKNPLPGVAAFLLTAAVSSPGATVVRDYAGGDLSNVDQSGAFASGTGGGSASNVLSVASFSSLESAAYDLNRGGVFNFELSSGITNGENLDTLVLSYGGTKSFTYSETATGSIFQSAPGSATPVSGTSTGTKNNPNTSFNFTFSTFTNSSGSPDLGLSAFGFSFLSRTVSGAVNYGVINVTATFSGGGTATSSATINALSGAANTFFGFQAPDGETISSVAFSGPTGSSNFNIFIDDIGFVTVVPEPSAFLLLGAGGLALVCGRRIRRCTA